MENESILVIPDLHCPFHHKDAFDFLDSVSNKYKIKTTVLLGDEIDGHTYSFHQSDPDQPFSPSSELEKAIWYLKDLYLLFPRATIIESNHGSLLYRKGKFHGIPRAMLRSYNDVLEAPKGWNWVYDLTLDLPNKQRAYFHHGLSSNPLKVSQRMGMNFIQGHHHGRFEIQYWANPIGLYWAITSGCLIDKDEMAFNYAKNNLPKPILGCTVILDGIPKLIPMVVDKRGRWTKKVP